jgi:hypothetical protein
MRKNSHMWYYDKKINQERKQKNGFNCEDWTIETPKKKNWDKM